MENNTHSYLIWFASDGAGLRPPDADGEGGGVRARRQQHGRRRPGQAAVAEEPELRGETLRCSVDLFSIRARTRLRAQMSAELTYRCEQVRIDTLPLAF